MHPIRFPGATGTFGKPKDWDEGVSGSCAELPVRVDGVLHTSVWRPTKEEREALANGSDVILTVCGGQPPVMLNVTDTEEPEIQIGFWRRLWERLRPGFMTPASATFSN